MLSNKSINKDSEVTNIQLLFSKTLRQSHNYVPCLFLYKAGKKAVSILSRPSSRTAERNPKDSAIREMLSTISVFDPDDVIFSADTNVRIEALAGGDINPSSDTYSTSALYVTKVSKSDPDFTFLKPYIQDAQNDVWWVNLPQLHILDEQLIGLEGKASVDPLIGYMRHQFSIASMHPPIKASKLFDELERRGHVIHISPGFYVE